MVAATEQVKFALVVPTRGQRGRSTAPQRHRSLPAFRAPSPARQRSRSPLPRAPPASRGNATAESEDRGNSERPLAALEFELELTQAELASAQQQLEELNKERAATDEEVRSVADATEASKQRRAGLLERLETARAQGRGALDEAMAAVRSAEAKVQAVTQEKALEVANVTAEVKAKQEEIAKVETRIQALEETLRQVTQDQQESRPEEVCEAAEKRWAAANARVAELTAKRSKCLEDLSSQPSEAGQLARAVLELEAKLESQTKIEAQLTARAQELGVDEASLASVTFPSPPNPPHRLYALTSDLPDVAGEYKLLPDQVAGRPAYVHKTSAGPPVHLFWSSADGHCAWTFAKDLPTVNTEEAQECIARSIQAAWTALPHELATSRWVAAGRSVNVTFIGTGGQDAAQNETEAVAAA